MKDGGPAFPCNVQAIDFGEVRCEGMTLRDYFAAKALPLVSKWMNPFDAFKKDAGLSELTKMAYEVADAMLKQREMQP